MKMIDDKGMLFGKINVIDFLVILFLVCILPAFYFGYKIFSKKPEPESIIISKKENIEISCRFIEVRPEILKIISIGDKELNENNEVIGKILKLENPEPYKYELDIGKGKKIIKKDKILKQVKAKLKLTVGTNDKNIFYKNGEIKIDAPFKFKTNKYELTAIPLEEETEGAMAVLKLKCSSLPPELVSIMKPGDRQIEAIGTAGDMRKETARLLRVVSDRPAEVITLLAGKTWNVMGHPKYRDVILEIEVLCTRRAEGLFRDDKPIKVGNPFIFSAEFYSVTGTIIGLKVK